MKVNIVTDERWPEYRIDEDNPGWGVPAWVGEDLILEFKLALSEWNKVQDKLHELYKVWGED